MTLDMSQFHQIFFEETSEHLGNMEALLLDLARDIDHPDADQLNAIFRAAHSIKGSAGTFGFTDLAEVTHILENLLDRIRRNELPLTEAMIDAFLDAGDLLNTLLAAHRGEGTADPQAVTALCARLRELTEAGATPTGTLAPPAATTPSPTPPPSPATAYEVRFVFDTQDNGGDDITNVMSALAVLGSVDVLERPSDAEQPWRLTVSAAANETLDTGALREMLEFVARSDSIRIEPHAPAGTSAHADDDDAYGLFTDSPSTLTTAAPLASSDDSFGFFEPLPNTEPAEPAPATTATAAHTDDANGAYGFFSPPADAPPASPPAAPLPTAHTEPAMPAVGTASGDRRATARTGDSSIRVGVEKIDQLINLAGELVITQAMLTQSAADIDPVLFERLHAGLGQLERNTRDLQEAVMSIRMLPISAVFNRFPRVVRDTAQKLGKQVELKTSGEQTELDKGLIERISDPLTHLIRNSLDHGIEMPEQRQAAGKDPWGTITLKAFHQGGSIVIEVGDDGAGLNRTRILAKARERGMAVTDSMSDAEVWALIFEAGFSTAEQITEVSGRGVGMDVVKRNIATLGGRIEIESMAGLGTRMTVRLPLTLAILDGISVAVGSETYILPIGCVIESLQAEPAMIKRVAGNERLIQVRNDYLPVLPLHEAFGIDGALTAFDAGIMVVVESAGSRFALLVDSLLGQHQVVIKSLEANYRRVIGISGATIMGDGRVAMILDVGALAGMAATRCPPSETLRNRELA